MNFLLSSEQHEIQAAVARFLEAECDATILHQIFDKEDPSHATDKLWRGLLDLGVGGLMLPDAYGGLGLELIDLALVAEVLGAHAAPTPFLGHVLASLAILLAGSDAQKARWLPRLADGSVTGSVAFAEGDTQTWQPDQWTLEASPALTGEKRFVLHGERADLLVVGLAGGRLGLVERSATGLSIAPQDGVDRTRRVAAVTFEATPIDVLAGDISAAERLRDAALVLLAADAFGGSSRCVEMAVEYAKTRVQFGVAIGQFQALKHQLAEMAVETEPARGLYWFAAHAFDHVPEQAARSAAQAKAHLTDRYLNVARRAIEAHGGIGYTWEFNAQIYLKRAMFDFAWLGAPAQHRARAAELAGW